MTSFFRFHAEHGCCAESLRSFSFLQLSVQRVIYIVKYTVKLLHLIIFHLLFVGMAFWGGGILHNFVLVYIQFCITRPKFPYCSVCMNFSRHYLLPISSLLLTDSYSDSYIHICSQSCIVNYREKKRFAFVTVMTKNSVCVRFLPFPLQLPF